MIAIKPQNFDHIRLNQEESVATIWLNRPNKFNALNSYVLAELDQALDYLLEPENNTRAIIITGTGEKAFCAGADLDELENIQFSEATAFLRRGQMLFNKIQALPIPVIAAVNGYALGGGMELAMACHLRLASENAQFGLPEAALGMIPAFGGTQRLPRLVGLTKATELMLTGRRLSATEAMQAGLINQVCSTAELMQTVNLTTEMIKKNSPISIEMILHSLRIGLDLPIERALEVERFAGAAAASSIDQRAGIEAFKKKEKPKFSGWGSLA